MEFLNAAQILNISFILPFFLSTSAVDEFATAIIAIILFYQKNLNCIIDPIFRTINRLVL